MLEIDEDLRRARARIAEDPMIALPRSTLIQLIALYDAVIAAYPDRTVEEIIAGLTVPGCGETQK